MRGRRASATPTPRVRSAIPAPDFGGPALPGSGLPGSPPTPPGGPAGRVALLVNRWDSDTSYVMPDLVGVAGDRAAEILRGQGFRVAVVASNPYPGVPAGAVLRPTPHTGVPVL